MEGIEKIYCCDRNNDAALLSALTNNNNGMEMAALMNLNNQWANNPFMYLIWLAFFGGGFGGWGARGAAAADATAENYNSRQIAQLQDTVNTNHNNDLALQAINGNTAAIGELALTMNCDYNSMLTAVNSVKSSIDSVGAAVGYTSESVKNSILMGDQSIMNKMSECCCENKLMTTTQGYESRIATMNSTNAIQAGQVGITNAINETRTALSNGIQLGFASTAYETQRQTCDIINNNNANTQKIIDTMTGHWNLVQSQALQDAKFEISQLKQNQYLINSLGGNCSCNC